MFKIFKKIKDAYVLGINANRARQGKPPSAADIYKHNEKPERLKWGENSGDSPIGKQNTS